MVSKSDKYLGYVFENSTHLLQVFYAASLKVILAMDYLC